MPCAECSGAERCIDRRAREPPRREAVQSSVERRRAVEERCCTARGAEWCGRCQFEALRGSSGGDAEARGQAQGRAPARWLCMRFGPRVLSCTPPCVWGHIERATARVQMCRGSGCPVRVRADAGWIVRDGAAGRARCGSTAGTTCVWPRREVELEQNFSRGRSENTDRIVKDKPKG